MGRSDVAGCLLLSGPLQTLCNAPDTFKQCAMSASMQQTACKPLRCAASPNLARRQQAAVPHCSSTGEGSETSDGRRSGRLGGLYLHTHPALPPAASQAPSHRHSRLQQHPADASCCGWPRGCRHWPCRPLRRRCLPPLPLRPGRATLHPRSRRRWMPPLPPRCPKPRCVCGDGWADSNPVPLGTCLH